DDGQVTKAKYCSNTYAAATMMSDDQSSMNWLYTNGTDAITSRIYDGHISADHDAYALGPDDSLHAVYYRINPSPAFIYLTNTGGQWREEIIAEGKNVGYYPDIAIDSLNRPHVAFWDHSIGQEKYAHRTESNWLIENIAGGAAAKIALLQNDAPVLLKTDNISLLQFSEKIGSAWHTEDIATGTTDGADIAISEINDVHIVFRREKSFYHATKNNGTWIEDFLLDVVSTSGNASVALDSLNRVHVAVDDITGANRFIYYSSNRSGAWDAFSLQQVIGTSEEGHITLGADDTVYIYTSSTKLVTNCTERAISGDGFNWERDWIDCADAGVSDAFIASDGSHIIAGASSGLILYSLPGI
ncbi:hypothetical protein K8I61_14210, partial [bacterium]|nr:hypothetical protein [bacterium]